MAVLERVKIRLGNEPSLQEDFLIDAIVSIEDRLKLRIGSEILPPEFLSITVEAVVKLYRKRYYEGIDSESVDSLSVNFTEDVLKEYEKEIQAYINVKGKEVIGYKVVRFI